MLLYFGMVRVPTFRRSFLVPPSELAVVAVMSTRLYQATCCHWPEDGTPHSLGHGVRIQYGVNLPFTGVCLDAVHDLPRVEHWTL